MERYDYREAVKNDVLDYIRDNIDFADYDTLEDLEEYLNDELWTVDSVTGNASGSYTFNTWQAEENLSHNWDLIVECASEFGIEPEISDDYKRGPEYWDVSIRCYLLSSAIAEALEEIENDFDAAHDDEKETEE